ncbi:hypothetical protein BV25DRAFT_1780889, partial [Artomyces pyxidatus]
IHHRSVEPTVDTISFYVVFMSYHIQPRSVRAYLSGICNQLEHVYPAVREIRKHPMVVRTLTGCMKLYNSPPTRKEPLTFEHLAHVLRNNPNPTHNDLLFRAILFSGFFALHRLGELTDHDRIELRSSRKTIMRATVAMQPRTYSYVLPGHKADRFFDGNIVIIPARDDIVDPLKVFTAYLASRDSLFSLQPALFLTARGAIPTRAWFISRLRKFFPAAIAGHSMRAGGATFYASEGWPDDRIQ